MSSETDHPRQRTVAELLAEHGEAGATGRRRRRREPDESDGVAAPAHSAFTPTGPATERRAPERPVRSDRPALPDRSGLRDPVPPLSAPAPEARRAVVRPAATFPSRPVVEPEHPTDVMPRLRAAAPAIDEGLTGPMPQQSRPARRSAAPTADEEAGPSTMIGAAPVGAEAWHDARTEGTRRGGAASGGGSPQPAGPVRAAEQPAGRGRLPSVDLEKHDDDAELAPMPRERRLGRATAQETAGPAWATVMMQWVAGAVGGAVLWVAFRFLWRNLPVVALASAVLVTVGLVVIVRALLHNNDRRTTIFAVLVGLLLTVSPAVLVLLGR